MCVGLFLFLLNASVGRKLEFVYWGCTGLCCIITNVDMEGGQVYDTRDAWPVHTYIYIYI